MSQTVKKGPKIPGFTALSDQIFLSLVPAELHDVPDGHPDYVLIYGWGDGLPKHVAKYADGFKALFPHSRQILVLSPISKALFSDLEQRSESMTPIVKILFPDEESRTTKTPKILAHTMSNTGAINYGATVNAYRNMHGDAMPHALLSMDSTPGSTNLTTDNLKRWSKAMALGTAGWFPWPFVVTQFIWAVALCINHGVESLLGRESAGAWSRKAANNPSYLRRDVRKLYMYSKEDDLILWRDIVVHADASQKLGWACDVEAFQGSGHVGHMRKHPEQYWNAILTSWQKAIPPSSTEEKAAEQAAVANIAKEVV